MNSTRHDSKVPVSCEDRVSVFPVDVLSPRHPAYPLTRIHKKAARIPRLNPDDAILSPSSYLSLAWTIAQMAGAEWTELASTNIYDDLPADAETEVRSYSTQGKSGLERVKLTDEIERELDYYRDVVTDDITGRSKTRWRVDRDLQDTFACMNGTVTDLNQAIKVLSSTGDLSSLCRLFNSQRKAEATNPATPHAAANNPAGSTTETDTTAEAGAAAANDVNHLAFGSMWASPPMSRLSAYNGGFNVTIASATRRTVVSPGHTVASPNGGSGRNRALLDAVSIDKQQMLLQRGPLGSVPRLPFPTDEVYGPIIEWRPILKKSEPLAAILQLILTSNKRDDNFDPDQPCTGMPFYHELVLAAFGFTSRQHAHEEMGVNSGQLFGLYRKHIDSDFHLSGWSKKEGRSRVVLAHSIPDPIINAVEEHMLGPEEAGDTTYLIGGLSADRRNNWQDHEERIQEVEERETAIPLPTFTKRMQSYLHGLTETSFSHGGYGYISPDIDKAFQAAREEHKDAQRRRQVLRKLCMIRQYPKPLYPACDFFPRLTSEGHNQLMNLPSSILRTLYTDRDRELDLSKAHLATTVPLAKKNGIDASILEKHLNRNLSDEDYDLWMDVASYFDVEYMPAARKAAKKLYSGAYGGSEMEVLKQMCFAYADAGGTQLGYDPFKPALEHPLVGELFRIREEIREIIGEKGYLVDAGGRKIRPDMMSHKDKDERWKSVMAYVNASFEQKLMSVPFRLATEEQKRDRPRFTIWLYQSDGITVRFSSRASTSHQVERIQDAVAEEAKRLGVPTELDVDWPE